MKISRSGIALFAIVSLIIAGGAARLLLQDPGQLMTEHAEKFIGTLSAEQKTIAVLKYNDASRTKWHFIPLAERKGLQVKHMSTDQRVAALGLLKSALSQVGYHKATEIMSLEGILRELEKDRKGGPIRDPERYYFTLFGAPTQATASGNLKSTGNTWGLSVEGHHLSLNFVVRDGKVLAHTPAFFGANPATVRNDIAGQVKAGTRTLGNEEQRAFDLLAALDAEQVKLAMIDAKCPADIRGPADEQPPQASPEGLSAAKLNDSQLKQLQALVAAYTANMPESIAEQRTAEIQAAGWSTIHFAWAGASQPGVGHYYRVQGPTFLIEFVNVQPDGAGNPANHIHAVWRDLRGDFGVSL